MSSAWMSNFLCAHLDLNVVAHKDLVDKETPFHSQLRARKRAASVGRASSRSSLDALISG